MKHTIKALLATTLYVMTACGSADGDVFYDVHVTIQHDSYFNSFKEEFMQDCFGSKIPPLFKRRIKAINIGWDMPKSPEDFAGVCYWGAINYVVMNPRLWWTYTHKQRKWLIAHELGHCIMNMEHFESIRQLDIMNPIMPYVGNAEMEYKPAINRICKAFK